MEIKEYKSLKALKEAINKEKAAIDAKATYKTYFATFGGGSPFANNYVGIVAQSMVDARIVMHQTFDAKWAFLYTAPGGLLEQIKEFHLKHLCYLKARPYGHSGEHQLEIIQIPVSEFYQVLDSETQGQKRGAV